METFSHENQKPTGFSTYLAIGSFGMGTIIFILYFLFPQKEDFLILGFFYLLFALLFNGVTFLNLLFQFCLKPRARQELGIKMLIMLANIPIALLYLYIVFYRF